MFGNWDSRIGLVEYFLRLAHVYEWTRMTRLAYSHLVQDFINVFRVR